MPNRTLAMVSLTALGAAWLSTGPAQAQLPMLEREPIRLTPAAATPPAADARPVEPGVDDILGQLERCRLDRAAIDVKERTLTELLQRKLVEQGERFKKLGLTATVPAGDAAKPASPLYFPTRIGTRRVYTAGGVEKVDVVTAVRAQAGGAVTVTVADPARPDSARHVRVSRTALELLPNPDGSGSRDVLRPAAASGEQWLPWGEGGLVFRQAGFEQVTVPAGTFRALRVDTGYRSGPAFQAESSVWYAPGVGTVREVKGKAEVLALKSFEPGD